MDYEKITLQIKEVQEQQEQKQQHLRQHEQFEQDIHELNVRGRRLFNELSDTWGKDKKLALEINHNKSELLSHERKIQFKLEDKKEGLLKEKRQLFDLEEQLFKERKQRMEKEDIK